jgi:hypothetical protein
MYARLLPRRFWTTEPYLITPYPTWVISQLLALNLLMHHIGIVQMKGGPIKRVIRQDGRHNWGER